MDLRGHGWSSVSDSGYDPVTFATDIAQLLLQLQCPPVVVVGHSLGGLIVSVLAVEYPEAVRALVAIDPGYLVADTTIVGMAPLLAGLATGDPVPTVQASAPAMRRRRRPFFAPGTCDAPPECLRTSSCRR